MLNNRYHVWYDQIIERAKNRARLEQDFETHHILPRSLGGSNRAKNLVRLTFREHFLVHWLLTKFTVGDDRRRMCWALCLMCWGFEKTSHQYEMARKLRVEAIDLVHGTEAKEKRAITIKEYWERVKSDPELAAEWASICELKKNNPEWRAANRDHLERYWTPERREWFAERNRQWAREGKFIGRGKGTKRPRKRPHKPSVLSEEERNNRSERMRRLNQEGKAGGRLRIGHKRVDGKWMQVVDGEMRPAPWVRLRDA